MERSWVTHGLALIAGGAVAGAAWAVLAGRDQKEDASAKSAAAVKADRADSISELRRQRNARLLEERIAKLRRDFEIGDAAPGEKEDLRRAQQRDQIAEREAETAKLLAASRHWQGVKDLGQPLSDAALAKDEESVMAIFLEWARRDPEAAFRELEKRPATWDMVDAAALAALPPGDFLAQLRQADGYCRDFFTSMGPAYATLLAQQGDLKALLTAREGCPDANLSRYLMAEFVDHWLPEDSTAAARQMVAALQQMSPKSRHECFVTLLNFPATPACLTTEFMQTLLAPDWQADNVFKEPLSGGPYSSFGCFPAPKIDLSGVSSDQEVTQRLEYWAGHGNSVAQEPDWAQLYADRRMTLDEVRASVAAHIPGADRYPAPVDATVCRMFFGVDPKAAIEWGQQRGVSTKELTKLAVDQMRNRDRGDLLLKKLDGAAQIDGWPGSGGSFKQMALNGGYSFHESAFSFWQRFDPEQAETARSYLPPEWQAELSEEK